MDMVYKRLEDFLQDNNFIGYALGNNESRLFWDDLLIKSPELKPIIKKAYEILSVSNITLPTQFSEKELDELRESIFSKTIRK